MKFHFHPVSTTSRSILFFMADQGIPYEPVVVDLMTGEHVKPPFTDLNPSRQVPVLDDEGFVMTECSAILKYIAEKTKNAAYPSDLRERARVNEIMDWFNTNLYREYGYHLIYPQVYPSHKREQDAHQSGTIGWGKDKSMFWLGVLDTHYLGHGKPYLLGDKLSIADYLGSAIISAGDLVGVDLKRFPNVDRWMKAMRARPGWAKTHEVHDGFAASLKGKPFETVV
jgi:glutathione S-transferase